MRIICVGVPARLTNEQIAGVGDAAVLSKGVFVGLIVASLSSYSAPAYAQNYMQQRDALINQSLQNMVNKKIADVNERKIRGWSAEAYRPITGVTGVATGMPNRDVALRAAVEDCVNQGGVPQCCQANVDITD